MHLNKQDFIVCDPATHFFYAYGATTTICLNNLHLILCIICVGGTKAEQSKSDIQSGLLPPSLFAIPANQHFTSK